MSISLIAASVLLFAAAPPQDSRPSAATLIEKARVLAEEQGHPQKGALLLLDKVICRHDLSKAQFDRVSRLIAIYLGGKPPKESPTQAAPNSQGELQKGIQSAVQAYLAFGKHPYQEVLWYGKDAYPFLLEQLKRRYFSPGIANKILPFLIHLDPAQTASFLRVVRTKGSEKFRTIIAKSLTPNFLRLEKNPGMEALWNELLKWMSLSPKALEILEAYGWFITPSQILTLLKNPPPGISTAQVFNSYLRSQGPRTLKSPGPLLGVVQELLMEKNREHLHDFSFGRLYPWLLAQPGGFRLALRAFAFPELRPKPWSWNTVKYFSFPKVEEGLPTFVSFLEESPSSALAWETLSLLLQRVWKSNGTPPQASLHPVLLRMLDLLAPYSLTQHGRRVSSDIVTGVLGWAEDADPTFLMKLWEKASYVKAKVRLLLKSPDPDPLLDIHEVAGGPELFLYKWKKAGTFVFSKSLDTAQRIQLFLSALKNGMGMQNTLTRQILSGESERLPVTCPPEIRTLFLEALFKDTQLLTEFLKKQGSYWLGNMPPEKTKMLLIKVWKDPNFDVTLLSSLFWGQLQREKNPIEFFEWALEKRPNLPPSFLAGVKLKSSYADRVLDWIETLPSSWVNGYEARNLVEALTPIPSSRAKSLLGRLLISHSQKLRQKAAQVLDAWKRVEEVRNAQKNRDLQNKLWGMVHSNLAIPARIVALEGLFDLGDKRAWLVLSQWLASGDKVLEAAATKLAERRRR